jgi:hypothetical protein
LKVRRAHARLRTNVRRSTGELWPLGSEQQREIFRLAREIVARRFPVAHPQSLAYWLCLQCVVVSGFLPSATWAEESVIIGATQQQERFLTCVLHISDNDLRHTPNSDERLTVVILEHQKFLEMREAFHAHKTKLAFSSLQARRIYLSSRMFGDFETLLRCITHELGHFATQSVYEGNAELAADRMRQRTRQICGSAVQ